MHQCCSAEHQFRSYCSSLDRATTDLICRSHLGCANDFPSWISLSNAEP